MRLKLPRYKQNRAKYGIIKVRRWNFTSSFKISMTEGCNIKDIIFHLVEQYGGIAIFFDLMLEYAGLPLPGESVILLLGFMSGGWIAAAADCLFAVAGTFTGSMFAYVIGYRFGETVVLKIGRPFRLTKPKLDHAGELMRRHEALYVIFSRFIPGVRHIIPYMSGVSKVNPVRNALYNLLSAIIWCASFIVLGRLTGNRWVYIEGFVKAYGVLAILLVLFVLAAHIWFKKHKVVIYVCGISVVVFTGFCMSLVRDGLKSFDGAVYGVISDVISGRATALMRIVSLTGSGYFLVPLGAALLILSCLLPRGQKKYRIYGIMLMLNLGCVSVLNQIFKLLFHRARPQDILRLSDAPGYSFPSHHSMVSAAFYGLLAYFVLTQFKGRFRIFAAVFLAALILAIGVSRVYLGVHFASDVVAGFAAGTAWLVVFITVMQRVNDKN